MSELTQSAPSHRPALLRPLVVWVIALAAFICALAIWRAPWPLGRLTIRAPGPSRSRAGSGQFTKWLLNDATFGLFTFSELTRFIAAVIDVPYRIALSLLSTGFLSGRGSTAVQTAAVTVLGRGDWRDRALGLLRGRAAAGRPRRRLPVVRRGLRAMDQRDGHAGLDPRRRAAGRRRAGCSWASPPIAAAGSNGRSARSST